MLVLGLFVFVAMLFVAGLAIDMMRYETERVRMQGAADRAVLAAASVRPNAPQSLSARQIAEAYLTAGGISASLVNGRIEVVESETGRQVTVAPAGRMPTIFMRMLGVNSFDMATPARALEAMGEPPDVEVVMVLDVSGSMSAMTANGLTRIENLRIAARDLVEELFDDTEPGQMAVTLVPYDSWVVPPAGFMTHFPNFPSGNGACADFVAWNDATDSLNAHFTRHSCNTSSWRLVRPYLHDYASAVAHIDNLIASTTTSIDLGVRFGAMFFDPTIRPAIEQMIDNGDISPLFANRPHDWDAENVIRAMVLMTDGENCCFGRWDSRSPNRSTQDAQTVAACQALRQQGVLLYAVAFEAPAGGIDMMQQCASSENHFFNTSGEGIAEVFRSIGSHIQTQRLRLTL